jgi:hypothetical protein
MQRARLFTLFQISATAILICFVMFIVISGVGVYYSGQSLVRPEGPIAIGVLFKVGLAFSVIVCILGLPFIGKPGKVWLHFLTMPVFVLFCSLYLAVSRPPEIDRQLSLWNGLWTDTLEVRRLQSFQRCCGWESARDRGLANCPMDYRSGCRAVIEEYLRPQFSELFLVTTIVFACGVVGWIACVVSFCLVGRPSHWFAMFEAGAASSSSW